MASRAVIEQAKGIIIGERRCTEDAAFALLVTLSQDTNRRLRDVPPPSSTKPPHRTTTEHVPGRDYLFGADPSRRAIHPCWSGDAGITMAGNDTTAFRGVSVLGQEHDRREGVPMDKHSAVLGIYLRSRSGAGLEGVRWLGAGKGRPPQAERTPVPPLPSERFDGVGRACAWATDLTFVPTSAGIAYVCFITDVFSRMIVGWRAASHMRTDMVLDALEMARWSRGTQLEGLRCHSDAGSQFTSVRYGERLVLRPPQCVGA